MSEVIGREKEKAQLQKIIELKKASFVSVYGRRRIGKTYLIQHFFQSKGLFFHLTGIQDAPIDVQLRNFAVEFSDHFRKGKRIDRPKDWFEAFHLLRKELEKVPKNKKIILFFDELPWLASPRSKMIQELDHLWNRYLSSMANVTLIVCGSAASWMIDHIINHRGGLHGRITHSMRLLPFTLSETEKFLQAHKIHLDRKQVVEIYMAFGGVAKYLTYLERGKSAAQMIGELCFTYDAPLIAEFHKLYRSLFFDYESHQKIVKALASKRSGCTYQEIAALTTIPAGGTLSKKISELVESGFIMKVATFGKKASAFRYVLCDEYSLFYLRWISGISSLEVQAKGAEYWIKQVNTQSWRSWSGYAYKNLCLKHIDRIKNALGLRAVETRTASWRKTGSKEADGAQIDLIIDRADQCINLCEIKFYNAKFSIDKEYAEKLRRKKTVFQEETKTRKALLTTLITTYGTKRNTHYHSTVDEELTLDALF